VLPAELQGKPRDFVQGFVAGDLDGANDNATLTIRKIVALTTDKARFPGRCRRHESLVIRWWFL
jgi:hypothetical protein